jgi:SAM-dependent methyltransferase
MLIEGNCVFGDAYSAWETSRRFIADAVHIGDTLLDVGGANGFLLRCLQEWVSVPVDVYGIDFDANALAEARQLIPASATSLADRDAGRFALSRRSSEAETFPKTFDVIVWNVWDNARFSMYRHRRILEGLHRQLSAGGRLILAFYDAPRSRNEQRIATLADHGYALSGTASAGPGRDEMIVWLDAPEAASE